jgi:hypothetical protein
MLRNASAMLGYTIGATDGRLGSVSDFLFHDDSWRIRWLVVDTGGWLSGRSVLLPPSALGHLNPIENQFSVRLTMRQVEDSPDISTDRPISRQMETNIYDYYGWSPYWPSGVFMGGYGTMVGTGMMLPLPGFEQPVSGGGSALRDEDPHLRSIKSVTRYDIHASDGDLGHVEDFLIEDEDWSVRYLVIDTRNWFAGKKVLISPRSVRQIDWSLAQVDLDVTRQRIKDSPPYDASVPVDRAYDEGFHRYYDT